MIDVNLFGGESNIDILENKMWLDLGHIQEKILRDTPSEKDKFTKVFSFMVEKVEEFESSDQSSVYEKINRQFPLTTDNRFHKIVDSLRKWYGDFCYDGIMHAYRGVDAELWYPKIIFKEKIKSDILDLPDKVTLYRGTCIDEYNSTQYGQSWTLSKSVAEEFAYKYYIYELNRQNSNSDRVILEMKVNRNDVLFYEKEPSVDEKEVIINSSLYKDRAKIICKKSLLDINKE